MDTGNYFTVLSDTGNVPLSDHLRHGYECRQDFARAVRQLSSKWKGRVGECIGERHDFLLLRFHDTPGGLPDEEWIPRYLLRQTEPPEPEEEGPDEVEKAIDEAFGFD